MAKEHAQPERNLCANGLGRAFRRDCAAYGKVFPESLARLYVTLGEEEIYVAPEIAAFLTRNTAKIRAMVEERVMAMNLRGARGTTAIRRFGFDTLLYLSVNDEKENDRFVSRAPGAGISVEAVNKTGTFDHEIGHIVTVNGRLDGRPHLGECAADAFAALRHIQRFGGATDIFRHAPAMTARAAVFGSFPIHYTSAVFSEVARLCGEDLRAIASLPLEDTARLAANIAEDSALDDATLAKIGYAFKEVQAARLDESLSTAPEKWRAVLKNTVSALRNNRHDDDICRAGRLFLAAPDVRRAIAEHLINDARFRHDLATVRQQKPPRCGGGSAP